jgi:alginate O-acetyltransferase complex protein AlgI
VVNFRQPYLATSLQEFWRRWHISLSTWLRDYLYIPLGGSRLGGSRTYRNLLLTMLIGGLWHGASWNFLVWGGLHGVILAVERRLNVEQPGSLIAKCVARIIVFHFVCLAWIFFRASTLRASLSMLGALRHWDWRPSYYSGLLYLLVFSLPLVLVDLYLEDGSEEYPTQASRFGWQLTAVATGLIVIAFAASYQSSPFVYFQF